MQGIIACGIVSSATNFIVVPCGRYGPDFSVSIPTSFRQDHNTHETNQVLTEHAQTMANNIVTSKQPERAAQKRDYKVDLEVQRDRAVEREAWRSEETPAELQ